MREKKECERVDQSTKYECSSEKILELIWDRTFSVNKRERERGRGRGERGRGRGESERFQRES